MARKICDGYLPDGTKCTRSVGTGPHGGWEDPDWAIENGWCFPCADEGQMSIAHLNGHESISEDDCWYCHPELDARLTPIKVRTGHTNTVAKSRTSHAGCKHARTPRDRAECRKTRTWNGERWV